MFLRSVIEDIDASLIKMSKGFNLYHGAIPLPKEYWDFIRLTRDSLFKAQCFHVGRVDDFITTARKTTVVNEVLFSDKTLKLPYDVTWFDWYDRKMKFNGKQVTFKRGVLVEVVERDPYTIGFTQIDTYSSDTTWTPCPVSLIVSITGNIGNSKTMKHLVDATADKLVAPAQGKENKLFLFHIPNDDPDIVSALQAQMVISAYIVDQTLTFLSCKNVGATAIKPPVKLQKKRVKHGKMPLFTYRVLTVKPSKQKKAGDHITTTFDQNRIHLCRGHYKEYTAESPLFGNIVGRYFWNAHVRGSNMDGIVVKDYNVEAQ